MERRQLRRVIAQQMEAHMLGLDFNLRSDATAEDRAEAARQKAYVMEPLLKKLRRAQGHGKQTGKIMTDNGSGTVVFLKNPEAAQTTIMGADEGATAEALLEESMAG